MSLINSIAFATASNFWSFFFESQPVELITTKTFLKRSTWWVCFKLGVTFLAICSKRLLSYRLKSEPVKLSTPGTFLKWPRWFIGKMLSIAFAAISCIWHFFNILFLLINHYKKDIRYIIATVVEKM